MYGANKHWYSVAMQNEYSEDEIARSARRFLYRHSPFKSIDPYQLVPLTLGVGLTISCMVIAIQLKGYLFNNPAAVSLWIMALTLAISVIIHGIARSAIDRREDRIYKDQLYLYEQECERYHEMIARGQNSEIIRSEPSESQVRFNTPNPASIDLDDPRGWS
ncbi:hypothetical protein BS297_15720 [Rhodococcus erythropolis]|uniref:Uncharacterized protein n=1 Tax=Rhodococcus erythropolis TaxID=1833 RepID=A0A0C3A8P5_RHOER|nr:hypothetical protein BS297_15720 [Rhodococcus erythropolis]KIM16524.1 hypothetical protein QV65_13200 [Rhodococcus erythropolis]